MVRYNQTLDKYSRNWCTIYSLMNILKYNFGISVKQNYLLDVLVYFDKLGKWFPAFWAYFSVIYNSFVLELNTKLWLNFVLEKQYISSFISDTRSWGIWVKNYNKIRKDAEAKWQLTLKDVDLMKNYDWKSYFHNLVWDGSKGGYIINSAWNKPFKCKLKVLKALQKNNFTYDPMRTIEPATEYTTLVTQITRQMARYEKQWSLDEYIERTPSTVAFEKARQLYNYWK